MIDPAVFPLFTAAFGKLAGDFLQSAAEGHVTTFFGKGLDKLSGLGGKDAVPLLVERAYAAWFKMILATCKGHGWDDEDLLGFSEAAKMLLGDVTVADELLRPVLDPDDRISPVPEVLHYAWTQVGCPLPPNFSWSDVAVAYRRQVEKQKILSAEFREPLIAHTLLEIREGARACAGVTPSADLARYAARMRQKYQILDLTALQAPTVDDPGRVLLRQVFFPQQVREDPPPVELPRDLAEKLTAKGEMSEEDFNAVWGDDEEPRQRLELLRAAYARRPPRPVLTVVGQATHRRIVVIGGPGSGKSTLTRFLLLSVLDPSKHHPITGEPTGWIAPLRDHLPLLIELRDYYFLRKEGHCRGFLDYCQTLGKTEGHSLNATWLDQRLKQGPSLVLFDGLDEIFDTMDRDRFARSIAGFAHDYPKARIIVTSRPIGYRDKVLRDAEFQHFSLEDFDDHEIEAFVRGWYGLVFPTREQDREQRTARVLKAVRSSRSIRLLAGNPLLLTIMTLIGQLRELPRERWRFYEYAAEVLCHHWDVNRHLEDEGLRAEYIGIEDKKELLRRIAFRMQSGEGGLGGNFIHGDDLELEIEAYLEERWNLNPSEATRVSRGLIEQLRERNYILCLRGPRLYGFVHRTFLEYFCAVALASQLGRPHFPLSALIRNYYAVYWNDPAWIEPLRLVCGLITEEDAAEILGFLVDVNLPSEASPPRNLLLATLCLAELRKLRPALYGVGRLITESTIFFDSMNGYSAEIENFALELATAAAEVSEPWPGREILKVKIQGRIARNYLWLHQASFAAWISAVLKGDEFVFMAFKHIAKSSTRHKERCAAVSGLALGWPDEATSVFLGNLAAFDEDYLFRHEAIRVLIANWPRSETTRNLLLRVAANDPHAAIRLLALAELAKGYHQGEKIRRFLLDRLSSDYEEDSRATIINQIEYWECDDATRKAIIQFASEDQSALVRQSALEVLALLQPYDPAAIACIRERALNAPESRDRIVALKALGVTEEVIAALETCDYDFYLFFDHDYDILLPPPPETIGPDARILGMNEDDLRNRINTARVAFERIFPKANG